MQSIPNKLDCLQTELFEFGMLAISGTLLNQSTLYDDLLFQSFNKPERKYRVGDSHGGVMIYVKERIYYKCRDDLEIRGIECLWIEVANHNKRIRFALFYRPPNSNMSYQSDIEDSIALAVDTGISEIIITGDLNLISCLPQCGEKLKHYVLNLCSFNQSLNQHFLPNRCNSC